MSSLSLNDQLVSRREDGYVDVTAICKAHGKKYAEWFRMEKNKAFIGEFCAESGKTDKDVILSIQNGKERRTWAHPTIALQISKWISADVETRVKAWLDGDGSEIKTDKKEDEKIFVENGVTVRRREGDGYVDVTSLCKAAGKEFRKWNVLQHSRIFMDFLSDKMKVKVGDLLEIVHGGNNVTWAHPAVALNIAKWVSDDFEKRVRAWLEGGPVIEEKQVGAAEAVEEKKVEKKSEKKGKKKEKEEKEETTEIVEQKSSEIKEYKFGSTDFMVPIREDGMINATALCKAGNKKFSHYTENNTTKEFLKYLESDAGIPISQITTVQKGNSRLFTQGTWVHRKVGYHLAQWISPSFGLKMEKILDDLEPKPSEKRIVKKDVQPLVINDYSLVYRKEDGYVDVTNLRKAGGKEFKSWNRTEKTQGFLRVLSRSVNIHTDLLIQSIAGGKNEDRKTWVHPHVAINIAQWISPEFDVQVSKWINNIKKDPSQIKEYKFGTSDLIVPIRADGMINATALCKAGNKLIGHYLENKNTKDYLEELGINIGIPIFELINIQVGGNYNGTWVHRKVGYHLAQWISPSFAVQVSNILDELFITGKVELGNEKSNKELESLYKEQITNLTTQLETTRSRPISTTFCEKAINYLSDMNK